jgi:hypothetical protein
MARIENKQLKGAFGKDEFGFASLHGKISNIKISRIKNYQKVGGCSICFPHGFECTNSAHHKNTRSWKKNRRSQYKSRIQ